MTSQLLTPPGDPDMTAMAYESMPFTELLGVVIDRCDDHTLTGRVAWGSTMCTVNGNLHGGFLMAVADSLGAMLTTRHLPDGAGTSTVSSATNFLRPAPEGIYDVKVELVHAGRRTVVVTTDIINSAGKVVSRTTQTQAVLS
jgi:uncharacterized protein (TIGR00369 family)